MDIRSLITKITGTAKKVSVAVSHTFVAIFGQKPAEDFAQAAAQVLKSELGKIALAVVKELSSANLSGSEKRAAAFARISGAAAVAGIETKDSLIGLLIELAVSALKGHFVVE